MEHTKITKIPDYTFADLSNLKFLILYDDKIDGTISDNAFQGLNSLQELNLSNTEMSIIPTTALQHLTKLKTLYLIDNNIHLIPTNSFQGLSSLEELTITDNPIDDISRNAFQGLTSLKTLSLLFGAGDWFKHPGKLSNVPISLSYVGLGPGVYVDVNNLHQN